VWSSPGASRTVTVSVDPRLLAPFDGNANPWVIAGGTCSEDPPPTWC
jgi:beta-glucosidase